MLDRYAPRDAVINVTLYVPFGVFFFLSLMGSQGKTHRPRLLYAVLTTAAGALLSASVEMAQLYEPMRVCSLVDLLCNTVGTLAGTALAATFPAAIAGAVRGAHAIGVFRLSSVMALLYLWAGYQLFPFFPNISPYLVIQKLRTLAEAGFMPWRDAFEGFAGWLAASALLERILGRERAGPIAALAGLLVPFKLFIVDRTTSAPEIAGAVLGILGWLALRYLPWTRLLAALLVIAAIVAAGLEPFRFAGPPQPFEWAPFLGLLRTSWEPAFVVLFRKSFLYGASVWMLEENGWGWAPSSLAVAVVLALIEAGQMYQPGHVPEITDPLLALLMGFGLMLMDRSTSIQMRTAVPSGTGQQRAAEPKLGA